MVQLRANLDFAKRYVAEHVLRETFKYIDRNPEENFPKLLSYIRRIAPSEKHRRQIDKVVEAYHSNPRIHAYINRFFEMHPNVKRRLVYNWFVNAQILGVPRHSQVTHETGVNVPNFILIDPTSACNLRCVGCWAGAYSKHDTLSLELMDRLCREAKEIGIHWITMSGGEPFLWPHLLTLAEQHSDMAFMLYTNGTLIDEKMADRLVEVGNISPAISLEGWKEQTDARRGAGVFDRIMTAMDLMRERGIVFGVSLTLTRENVDIMMTDEFIKFLMQKGAMYGWSFHYIPIGRDPNPDMMLTSEQRAALVDRIHYIRNEIGLQIADFWNDGDLTQGCLGGGRRYFHICADGTIEPCAFIHFSTEKVGNKSLMEILQSPLFKAYQQRQPFSDNLLRACPLIDVPQALRDIVAETGAQPTHPGAETALTGPVAEALDEKSAVWSEVSGEIWKQRHPEAKEEAPLSAK